ncbi:hypothetical protein WJX72_005418 [[Myrmecia] bisecta]|uniref:UDENN domain-containing protein n=1 Tax=[Myrmecia] bisecta TaxID=41462 RepID=A0AAW1QF50_9CHLO
MLTAASGHEDERSAAFTPPQLPRRDSGSRQASVLRRASERLKLAMAAQEELLQAEPRAANGEGAVDGSMLGGHRRTRSGQLRDAELAGVEPSGNSASTTNSFHTAASSQAREGALGGAGDAFSPYSGTPSSHVRNISGESLSGFSECNTPARGLPNGLPMALDRDSGSDTPSRLAHASGPEPASTAAPAERPPAVSERGETVFPEAGPSNRPGTFQRPSVKSNVRSMSFRTVMRSASENDARHMGSSTPANALQVMQSYFETEVPQPGEEYEFCPDPGLQPVHYYRPKVLESLSSEYVHRTAVAAAEAEAAEGLRHWTVAALCRSLSLENILMLITGALLERQMVFFCPNIGVLSTTVLSLVPLLRPFAWQSLLLPVLPASMLAFLEAPVPFILGVQYKTGEVASRCGSLIRVNIYKDKIKNAASLPALPNHHALLASLAPSYWQLNSVGRDKARTRPIYAISEAQRQAAEVFLKAMEAYLSGLCSNLKLHTITDVQTTDRVSLLLKDSFIDSFSAKDRPFIRQFAETQMFSVYSDSVIT